MKLTSIKNCHSCAIRSGCKLKNSTKNLLDKARIFDTMTGRILRHGIPIRKRSSFCADYEPENLSETERIMQDKKLMAQIRRARKGKSSSSPYKPVMLTTPFHVVTKNLIRKRDLTKKTARKRWKK